MDEPTLLAEQFEEHRPHLRSVAYRMLGSLSDSDDAVQEAWLRLSRTDQRVENLGGWLTTVVGRVCLDMLRARRARQEDYVGSWLPEPNVSIDEHSDPEQEALSPTRSVSRCSSCSRRQRRQNGSRSCSTTCSASRSKRSRRSSAGAPRRHARPTTRGAPAVRPTGAFTRLAPCAARAAGARQRRCGSHRRTPRAAVRRRRIHRVPRPDHRDRPHHRPCKAAPLRHVYRGRRRLPGGSC